MTKQQRERLQCLKREATQAKSALIRIMSEVGAISPAEGRKLGRAINAVERWQVTGAGAPR